MLDEFDDTTDPEAASERWGVGKDSTQVTTRSVARLVSRMYGGAPPALRPRLLACLVRPLGTLGLFGVAAGAFGALLYREGPGHAGAAMGDMARFSKDQVVELARFVEQVSPDALQEFAQLFTDPSMGVAAFSVSAALLLLRALRRGDGGASDPVDRPTDRRDA